MSLHTRFLAFALPVLALLGSSLLAQSQATTGAIEGVVSDPSGKTIPGATVQLLNLGTNFARDVTTDSDGRFRGVLLPLGAYRVTVAAKGFGSLVREGIDLAVGQTVNLPLALSLSSIEQKVTVLADAPVIETTQSETSTYIDRNSIRTLPNNGRNFFDFVKLTPGVAVVQGPDGDEISVNGQKGINNNISVDGADNNNPFFGEIRGGQRPAFTVNLDAVKEFVVVADGAPAEFGRSSGAFINVVTKSGTNQVHGTAHEFQKFTGLTSRLSDGTRLGGFSQEQFGGTIGGPVKKDKLFYFAAYDQQIFRQTKQNNPLRIDPSLVNFFATKFADPNENGNIKRTNDANAILGKIDYNLNAQNLLTFRYNYSRAKQVNGTFDVEQWGRSSNGIERDFANTFNTALNTTLSPTTLNEFRFQFSREDRPRGYNGPKVPGDTRFLPDTGVSFAGYRFGEPFFLPVEDHDDRIQIVDNVTFIRGRHTFKAGFEFNRTNTVQTFIGFANGRYLFDSVSGFMNYVNIGPKFVECSDGSTSNVGTCPSGTKITGPLLLFLQFAGVNGKTVQQAGTQSLPQLEPAFFVQDKWQYRQNLTISYGLRWEAQIEPPPITPPSQVFFTKLIGTQGFPSNGKIPSDLAQWQPRLGITWDPSGHGKTVIRINGGIFYARTPGLVLAGTRTTNGSIAQNIFRNSSFNGFGVTPPVYPSLVPNAGSIAVTGAGVTVTDKNYQNPRTYQWSAGIEQEIAPSVKVYSNFNYAKGVHNTRFVDRNDAVFGSPFSYVIGDGNALTTVESSGKSLFRGWTTGVTKRMSQHFQLEANYQLSKDLSDDDNERDPFTFYYAVANNFKPEYNYSSRDQRHRFNAFGLYQAPKGFEFSGRFSAHSAQPKSVDNRIRPDGSVITRNTLRKDNAFTSFDLRGTKDFKLNERFTVQGIVEAFNLFNSKNFKDPSTNSLLFNFDGTIASGLGDPRQAQLGLRLVF